MPLNTHYRYHHVTVLSFTWAAYAARHPGLHFIAMNYTVHAVMYTYFFLMAIDAKPKWLKYVPLFSNLFCSFPPPRFFAYKG